jgi:putative hydrolase of the HAD superfamily
VGQVYAEVAARNGHPGISAASLDERFAQAWRGMKNFSHTRAEWAELVDATFRGSIQPPPSQTFFAMLYDRFTEPGAWRIFPDVLPALQRLRSLGLKLGIISNWDDRLRPLLHGLGLDRYFETIIVSCEVGCPKPASRIFDRAAQELGNPASALLHIGDSLEMDVRGAEAAGMKALWLNRQSTLEQPGVLRSLTDL